MAVLRVDVKLFGDNKGVDVLDYWCAAICEEILGFNRSIRLIIGSIIV